MSAVSFRQTQSTPSDSVDDQARPEALLTEVLLTLGFSLTEK